MKNRSLLIFVLLLSTFSFAQIQQRIHQSDGSILQLPLTEIDSINFSVSPPAIMHIHRADSAAKNISISEIDSATFSGFDFGDAKLISLMGQVMDEEGSPLFGVEVQVGNRIFNSDSNGVFYFPEAPVSENLGYVRASKAGYFPGLRTFVPTEGTNRVEIRLLRQNIAGTFNAVSGGTVQAEGVNIIFPAGGITKNGSAYSGTVRVALNYINPQSPDFDTEMPGNLLGVMNGNLRGLISYGMFAGELKDDAGNELELAPGVSAEVRFPLSQGLMESAPETIDFWHFDEQSGLWSHEGLATKEGNEYIASVSHFSFWNCDIPFPVVMLRGRVVDSDGTAIQGAKVSLTSPFGENATDYTSTDGHFAGYAPANMILELTVLARCGAMFQEQFSSSVGPYTITDVLEPLQISAGQLTTVSGRIVDCNGVPVQHGYVAAGSSVFLTDSLGNFSFRACEDSLDIRAISTQTSTAGPVRKIVLSGNPLDIGDIEACESIFGTITDIDGNTYRTVVIGTQNWMAENLNTSHYLDGLEIPNVTDTTEWKLATYGAWCYYDNSLDSGAIHGKLYNWYAVSSVSGLCPAGWHIPTLNEWDILINFLGGLTIAGGKLKNTTGWETPNRGASNESGFSALPGGYIGRNGIIQFGQGGRYAYWWFLTEEGFPSYLLINSNTTNVYQYPNNAHVMRGHSVRCIKD